ncbi:Gfo/Idh/MocA family oxidoreductase [Ostreiculturibacter nitratireducens]|uniref:Gfo/Idh/MocA family protein n=1 Tax=Ostreiculturibacter nitratireducens TaxID=3075226 RepID=UPI0031B5D5E4
MRKIRYAVVGTGWISQQAFMPAVAQTGNSEMTAIVSGNPDNAAKLAAFYGIESIYGYDAYDEMLAAGAVDAVYVALPNSLHAEYAIRAARAGKHVLVEKPLATTVEECEAMIAAAEETGVWLMTAYRLHNDPVTVEALERIRAGAIGEPRLFTSVFSFQSALDNHRLKAEHWGGPLQDIGVYCLNAARHVFGAEPVEAIAMKGQDEGDPRFTEVEETIAVTLRFSGGRFAQFLASFGAEVTDFYRVIGTKGEIVVDPGFRLETDTAMRLRQGEETVEQEVSPQVDHFGAQTAYFSDCILNGTRPEADGSEGLADVRAMLAIERAAATGQPQRIETPPRPRHPAQDTIRLVPRTDRRLLL